MAFNQRLADRPFGQLQALMPAVQVGDQRRVELGFRIRNAILVDRVEVASELLEVDDVVLGDAAQQRARHFGLQAVAGDVIGQQPGAGVRHLPAPDQMQILQRSLWLHAGRYASARGEARPRLRLQITAQIEARARRFVKADQPFLIERLSHTAIRPFISRGRSRSRAWASCREARFNVRICRIASHAKSANLVTIDSSGITTSIVRKRPLLISG